MTAPTFEELLESIRNAPKARERVLALTEGLKMQVADVLAIIKLPAPVAAEIDGVFAKVREWTDEITVQIMTAPDAELYEPDDDDD